MTQATGNNADMEVMEGTMTFDTGTYPDSPCKCKECKLHKKNILRLARQIIDEIEELPHEWRDSQYRISIDEMAKRILID